MRRRIGCLSVVGLAIWGCGPPQPVQMMPPGYVPPPTAAEGMEAEGEVKGRGVVQPGASIKAEGRPSGDAKAAAPSPR